MKDIKINKIPLAIRVVGLKYDVYTLLLTFFSFNLAKEYELIK